MSKLKLLIPIYLSLSILGLVITWYYNFQYFAASENIYFSTYLETLLVNPATTAVTIDIYIVALVFSIWVFSESKRVNMKWPFLYVVLSFGVGLAFAFPLFLAMRERIISRLN